MSERSFKTRPQCGLCNAVSNVFRRLLCVGPSRRGSSESYYQQLDPVENYEREHEEIRTRVAGTGDVEEEKIQEDNHAIVEAVLIDPDSQIAFVKIRDEPTEDGVGMGEKKPCQRSEITQSELSLIKTMETYPRNSVLTGRFLTMHKRRRKKLTTRSLSNELAPALLDDVHHGLVKCVLDRVWQWPFNAFTLDVATGGRSLPVLCVHLFHWYGLLDFFKLEVVDVWKLFTLIEEGYHSTNPYHNSIHATDVTQAMHCFLQEEKIRKHITPLEIMASLIAAVSHDLDHPGVNQPFLIATSNHLAALYQNTSVLENHHWRSAVGCLLESHVADRLRHILPELERQISSLILATDITRQGEFLLKFKTYLNEDSLRMEHEEDRHFILQIALKCADISNPCRPWDISKKWSQKVCEEFFRQGDYEQQLGLPLTALCDRSSSSVPKIQVGFFQFVVIPLFDEWHRFLGTKLSTNMMAHLKTNNGKWEALLQQELAEETRTEISDADTAAQEDTSALEVESQSRSQTEPRRGSMPSLMLDAVDRAGRRYSVPLNLPREFSVYGPSSSGRRESLPVSVEPRHKPVLDLHLEEEDEDLEFSYRSSCSGSLQKSSDCGSVEERPVSAESLLPEPSIATITSALDPTRLSNVLHGCTMLAPPVNKILTRQQTFPPIQTFVRTRYLSTAGEIVAQTLSDSSSTNSSRNELSSSVRTGSTSSENSDNIHLKRDSTSSESDRERGSHKIPKFSEKENVNPRKDCHDLKFLGSLQELLFSRRGSAPVTQESVSPPQDLNKAIPRRGSVPTDVSRPGLTENKGIRRSSLPYELLNQFSFSFSATVITSFADTLDTLPRRQSSDSGKSSRRSSRNRKSLKRRSSGGPDILLPAREEKLNVPRRGSLPCDVLPTYIKK